MEQAKWNFGALTEEAEVDYINAKMKEVCSGQTLVGGDEVESERGGSAADTYDELQPPSEHNPARCPVCTEAHWTCEGRHPKIPAALSTLLQRLPGAVPPTSASRTTSLWQPAAIPVDDSDVVVMADVIACAHRFVRQTEGDR